MTEESAIIKALEEMGYLPVVCKVAKNLYGYQGDKRSQKAHIVIPKKQISSASNDIGFEKVGGEYILHISEYDQSLKKFNQEKFSQLYKFNKIYGKLKKSSRFSVLKQTINEKGDIKIRIRRK